MRAIALKALMKQYLAMGVKASKFSRIIIGFRRIKGSRRLRSPPSTVTPRGYIPISVGMNGEAKLFMVHTTALSDADFLELLCRSAEEYGFHNQGILKIPCEAKAFEERMIVKGANPKVFKEPIQRC